MAEARVNRTAFLTAPINGKGEPAITDLLIGDVSLNELLKLPE